MPRPHALPSSSFTKPFAWLIPPHLRSLISKPSLTGATPRPLKRTLPRTQVKGAASPSSAPLPRFYKGASQAFVLPVPLPHLRGTLMGRVPPGLGVREALSAGGVWLRGPAQSRGSNPKPRAISHILNSRNPFWNSRWLCHWRPNKP